MNQARYLIDELCRLTGFSRRTVRYYVQEGIVDPPAGRGRGGYYSDRHVAQLARIRELQDQGYRLDAIRGMLASRDAAEALEAAEAVRQGQAAPPSEAAYAVGAAQPPEAAPASATAAEASLAAHLDARASRLSPPGQEPPPGTRSSWTRYVVAAGFELHVSAVAASRFGPAVATALEALRSIIHREGGLHE